MALRESCTQRAHDHKCKHLEPSVFVCNITGWFLKRLRLILCVDLHLVSMRRTYRKALLGVDYQLTAWAAYLQQLFFP